MSRSLLLLIPLLVACPTVDPVPGDDDAPSTYTYTFESRFDGEDSVAYSGQTFRHVLIHDLKSWIGGLTPRLDEGWFPAEGDVVAELNFFLEFDGDTSGGLEHGITTTLGVDQVTYGDIASGKDLLGKLAGNDPVGQHATWATDFVGWDDPLVTTPESLVRLWTYQIEDQAIAWSTGGYPLDPTGAPVPAVYVTAEGHDLNQLMQKFLLGAIAYSQGTDDYLDDDLADGGLNSDHEAARDGANNTALEHAWDEGFGYFGATRDYGLHTDDEIADMGAFDADGSGSIDLLSEYAFGHSVNAAKRDRGSVEATDWTAQAWTGFVEGRAILAASNGPLTDEEMAALQLRRDDAVEAWEAALGATVIHYINEVIVDGEAIGTDGYSFADHAKHWSEMKGFALGLQFNPRSKLAPDRFAQLHELIGMAPALAGDDVAAYNADLITARDMLGDRLDLDPANLGDDHGLGGW
ncbi:MAG: DUF4856 domain-containing protein [Proteobacteria bacterium]|nr:DUF4856 domain-containing protein [Pseudomonadota bacterium]